MISDTFKNTIWIYYETNLKARTRKEYWNVVKNFDKVVGHDPLELSHTDAVTYYEHILNKISKTIKILYRRNEIIRNKICM